MDLPKEIESGACIERSERPKSSRTTAERSLALDERPTIARPLEAHDKI